MPATAANFSSLPDPVPGRGCALDVMGQVQAALGTVAASGPPQRIDISGIGEDERELVGQILGQGEISIRSEGAVRARIQEAVLAGVWRAQYLDAGGAVEEDRVEVCDVPPLARQCVAPPMAGLPPPDLGPWPPGLMNAPAILEEVRDHAGRYQPGTVAHVINLTLLPVSPADRDFLESRLGRGTLRILSRGYGNCRIDSTAFPFTWWVRYFNSMGKLIVNTIEVVDVPVAACAAQEDIQDSNARLHELLVPYR